MEQYILNVKDLQINIKEFTVIKGNELIWNDPFLENDNSVLVHIRNLREKIGDKFKESKYIKTIWGVGYKIEKEN